MSRTGKGATRLRAGTVNVNDAYPYAAAWGSVDTPMGGWKDSGMGRRHGEHGLLKYTESQTVAVERLFPIGPPPFMSAGSGSEAAAAPAGRPDRLV